MAVPVNFSTKTVPELRQFLSQRGISCYEYRKLKLVRLAEVAFELNLDVITPEDDSKDMLTKRRTIKNYDGSFSVAPDLDRVNWSTDLKDLPFTEMADLLIYFIRKGEWSDTRLKNYRQDNGYKLFKDRHINDVKMCKIPNSDYVYIAATCIRETNLSENPYTTWLLLQCDGQIFSGGCSCVAFIDDGTCKHCTALLFAVADFSGRHIDRNTTVGTDEPCKWDQPRKVSAPSKIDDINITHNQIQDKVNPTLDTYQPSLYPDTLFESVETDIIKLCKDTGAVLLHLFDPLPGEDDLIENSLPTMVSIASKLNNSDTDESFLDILRMNVTKDVILSIEKATSKQSECDDWYKQRTGRITASIAYSVCNFRDTNKENNYILKKIMNPYTVVNTVATAYGREHEAVAKLLYSQYYEKGHQKSKIGDSGLSIDEQIPYLGASPDGHVACKCCGKGLIEIKCTHSHRDLTPEEICLQNKTYFIYLDGNNNVRLKKNSSWFYQIQMQLGICKRKWCDFVFYTQKGFIVDRIEFDKDLFDYIQRKCEHFFNLYVLPALKKEALKLK